jgi:hypothetical protein
LELRDQLRCAHLGQLRIQQEQRWGVGPDERKCVGSVRCSYGRITGTGQELNQEITRRPQRCQMLAYQPGHNAAALLGEQHGGGM